MFGVFLVPLNNKNETKRAATIHGMREFDVHIYL